MAERIPLRAHDGAIRAYALVDAADAAMLAQWRWSLSSEGYARRGKRVNGQHTHIKMHRQLLGLERGDERQGDHINGDRLDNRRANLRVVSASDNARNRLSDKGSSSRFRGVSFHARSGKWQASAGRLYLGLFADEAEAAEVARLKRVALFGAVAA